MTTEALARELHDVAFAWNHNLPPWDGLDDVQREWFTERAAGILDLDRLRVAAASETQSERFARDIYKLSKTVSQ